MLAIRPDDLFFGAKSGDVQPDWLDTSKIAIPQADEQQRLLVNLVTLMERDRMPIPHFWYQPRGAKAAVVMSGDDHSPGSAPYTSVPSPVSSRTHCVDWPDWASASKIELARGIRMDANYFHYPDYKQLLTWMDGRNSSTIRGLNWNAGTFTFVTTVGAGADGLQTMLPVQGPTGALTALTCGGSPQPFTVKTIKGIQYGAFTTVTGTCRATYS